MNSSGMGIRERDKYETNHLAAERPPRRSASGAALVFGCERPKVTEIVRAEVTLAAQGDILRARSAGRDVARSLGFSTADQTRLATAISELSRNALNYGLGGTCTIFTSKHDDGRNTIRIVVADKGPGIPDLALALQPGFSSGGGLGQGLTAVRRLMDELNIESAPGRTLIEAKMSRKP